jgi:ATP-dependent Zn protease
MVRGYGMSGAVGCVALDRNTPLLLDATGGLDPGDGLSEATARTVDHEVRSIVERQHTRVRALLAGELEVLRRVATELLAKETLTGDDIAALLRPAPTLKAL